jgi:hypothetical protein
MTPELPIRLSCVHPIPKPVDARVSSAPDADLVVAREPGADVVIAGGS